MKKVLAILLAVMLAATMVFTTAAADTNPNTFNDEDEVLNVYEYTPGVDKEPQLRHTYTYGELLALSMENPIGYMFYKSVWRICAVREYAALGDVLADSGVDWDRGDTLKCVGSGGYQTAVTYETLEECRYFFPDGEDAGYLVEVPAAIVISWNSDSVGNTNGDTPQEVLNALMDPNNEMYAYRSDNLRFGYGISIDQFVNKSAMGARLPQGLSELIVVHECAEHDWVQDASKQYRVDGQRTCTEGAWYYEHCTQCGKNGEKFYAEALGHNFHYKTTSDEIHEVTCLHGCGYFDLEEHTKTYTYVSEEGHSVGCEKCTYIGGTQPHEFDANGVCICGAEQVIEGPEVTVRIPETTETTGGANPATGAAQTAVAAGTCYTALILGAKAA